MLGGEPGSMTSGNMTSQWPMRGRGGKPKTEGGECTPLPKHVVDPPYLYIKNKIGGRKWLQINPQKNRKDLAGERSLLPKTYNLP
jgi:hypothetical protein